MKFAGEISQFIQNEAHRSSQALAEQRGSFPNSARKHLEDALPASHAQCLGHHHRPDRQHQHPGQLQQWDRAFVPSGLPPAALDGQEFIEVHPFLETLRQGMAG